MIWDVIIVGGGPAGMAVGVHLKGKKVLILEKQQALGEKLKLTGAGQCNVTHGGEMSAYKEKYNNWRFARHCLMSFTNQDLIHYFESRHLKMTQRSDGKYFPESMRAEDVIETLIQNLKENKIDCRTDEAVTHIEKAEHFILKTQRETYQAHQVVVATGGISYPKTGSTGDGIKFAKALGIDYIPYRYALSPVYIKDHVHSALMGLSFKNLEIHHYRGKKINTYKGDLLVTHFGYSGPVILNASRWMMPGDELIINFLNMTKEAFENFLLNQIKVSPKKKLKTILNALTQQRFVEATLEQLNLLEMTGSELKKKDRQSLVRCMTEFRVSLEQVGKSHIAMVSTGGIKTSALNKKTFETQIKGLYFIGECVDIDGDTGGYNIQYAFSSGVMAAEQIRRTFNE